MVVQKINKLLWRYKAFYFINLYSTIFNPKNSTRALEAHRILSMLLKMRLKNTSIIIMYLIYKMGNFLQSTRINIYIIVVNPLSVEDNRFFFYTYWLVCALTRDSVFEIRQTTETEHMHFVITRFVFF